MYVCIYIYIYIYTHYFLYIYTFHLLVGSGRQASGGGDNGLLIRGNFTTISPIVLSSTKCLLLLFLFVRVLFQTDHNKHIWPEGSTTKYMRAAARQCI